MAAGMGLSVAWMSRRMGKKDLCVGVQKAGSGGAAEECECHSC